ncbi:peptidylprolyl isomerase [Aestuariibius sp. 2305UL40-4]|uniref:peptidylprolyl isomerase n=1 Tax=Aestuariibius violaceus TaxID=3234132 RepID=UPI00345E2FC3
MTKHASLLASAALALVLTQPVFAQDQTEATEAPAEEEATAPAEAPTADTVIATVNGTDITLGHLVIARAQLPAQYQQLPAEILFDGVLDQLIQQTLLADQLEEETGRLQLALDNERRSLRAGEVITEITESAVTEEALQEAYDTRFADVEPTQEYNASHILVETEEEAQEVITELEGGADFAELAQDRSTGPSGPNGGELGWFGPGMMVAPFEEAVVALEVGEVSGPVETQFGWHVIILNDSRQQEAPPIEQLRPELEAELQQAAIEARVNELTEGADITRPEAGDFDPAILNDLSILDPQ